MTAIMWFCQLPCVREQGWPWQGICPSVPGHSHTCQFCSVLAILGVPGWLVFSSKTCFARESSTWPWCCWGSGTVNSKNVDVTITAKRDRFNMRRVWHSLSLIAFSRIVLIILLSSLIVWVTSLKHVTTLNRLAVCLLWLLPHFLLQ